MLNHVLGMLLSPPILYFCWYLHHRNPHTAGDACVDLDYQWTNRSLVPLSLFRNFEEVAVLSSPPIVLDFRGWHYHRHPNKANGDCVVLDY